MQQKILQAIEKILPEAVELRHKIHANPELKYEEHQTAQLVQETLEQFGYEVETHIAETGMVAILDSGKPGKVVALRADMDALPIEEQTGLAYQSKNKGKMHACGHDGHTATLLAAAYALQQINKEFNGKIKLIFQPAEEAGGGALAMIHAGVLKKPKVDAIFGYHNYPTIKQGCVGARVGCILAGADFFTITIQGKGGHGAIPEASIDPIYVGSLLVQALQGLVSRVNSPLEPAVLSVTQFQAGNSVNIIPDQAILKGGLRTTTSASRKVLLQQFKTVIDNVVAAYGASASIEFVGEGFPPTINTKDEVDLVYKAAKQVVGDENTKFLSDPIMATEDFSYFLQEVPGCFFLVGNGEGAPMVHTAGYDFNDAVIPVAAKVMCLAALEYLNS